MPYRFVVTVMTSFSFNDWNKMDFYDSLKLDWCQPTSSWSCFTATIASQYVPYTHHYNKPGFTIMAQPTIAEPVVGIRLAQL